MILFNNCVISFVHMIPVLFITDQLELSNKWDSIGLIHIFIFTALEAVAWRNGLGGATAFTRFSSF